MRYLAVPTIALFLGLLLSTPLAPSALAVPTARDAAASTPKIQVLYDPDDLESIRPAAEKLERWGYNWTAYALLDQAATRSPYAVVLRNKLRDDRLAANTSEAAFLELKLAGLAREREELSKFGIVVAIKPRPVAYVPPPPEPSPSPSPSVPPEVPSEPLDEAMTTPAPEPSAAPKTWFSFFIEANDGMFGFSAYKHVGDDDHFAKQYVPGRLKARDLLRILGEPGQREVSGADATYTYGDDDMVAFNTNGIVSSFLFVLLHGESLHIYDNKDNLYTFSSESTPIDLMARLGMPDKDETRHNEREFTYRLNSRSKILFDFYPASGDDIPLYLHFVSIRTN